MEPVTHLLTGACLGRAGFNRRTAYATLAMTLAAEAPDLDMLWGFQGPVAVFQHHRGITHTLAGAPFVALFVTGAIWLFDRWRRHRPSQPVRWKLVWLFALIAALSHLLLDFTNNYGLRPFFPFNPRWYSWDIVFIFEPVMFALLLGALVMPALLGLADREIGARRPAFRGRGWAIFALAGVALLYVWRNAEHERALAILRLGEMAGTAPLKTAAEPYPINPFRWYAVVETPEYYQTGTIDTRSGAVESDPAESRVYKPPVTLATLAAKRSWVGQVYLDWSQFPLVEDRGGEAAPGAVEPPRPPGASVLFRDLRFSYSALGAAPRPGGRRGGPLTAWVYVGPEREIEGMWMDGRRQP